MAESRSHSSVQLPTSITAEGTLFGETVNAFIQETPKRMDVIEVTCQRIEAHCEQITWCLNKMRKQSLAEEYLGQPTSDNEDTAVDTCIVTNFERSMDFNDNDDVDFIEPDALDVAVELVEPIVVEDADKLSSPDLMDEQRSGEECKLVFGLPELTIDFFSFQHFYFIPSASSFKNCSNITIADLIVHCCFLQDVGKDCLLMGPADVLEEDGRIQEMEWLKLEKEFG